MEETRGEMVAHSPAGTQLPKAKLEETVLETSPENGLCRARSLGQEACDENRERSSKVSEHWGGVCPGKVSREAVFSTCQRQQVMEVREPIKRSAVI